MEYGEKPSQTDLFHAAIVLKQIHSINVLINPKVVVIDVQHYQPALLSSHIPLTELKNLCLFSNESLLRKVGVS